VVSVARRTLTTSRHFAASAMTYEREIAAHKFRAAILLADLAEDRVRDGEIDMPDWFLKAGLDAWRLLERISAESKV
jgi:hypothetical protein